MAVRTHSELANDALHLCIHDFTHSFARFTALDGKAYNAATVSGVLLASTLAFVPQDVYRSALIASGSLAAICARLVIVLTVAALVFAYLALEVSPARTPFRADAIANAVTDLISNSSTSSDDDIVMRHYLWQLNEWSVVLKESSANIKRKARFLVISQGLVAAAAVMIGIVAWVSVTIRA